MKKTITVLTAAVLLLTTTAFASEGIKDVNANVKTSFQKDFSKANNVSWTSKDNFYFAEFTVDNRKLSAAYNEEGELVATSRVITPEQLPLLVSQSLQQRYPDYKVGKPVTEIILEKQTSYYLVISDGKKVLHLKANASGEFTVEKKTKL